MEGGVNQGGERVKTEVRWKERFQTKMGEHTGVCRTETNTGVCLNRNQTRMNSADVN